MARWTAAAGVGRLIERTLPFSCKSKTLRDLGRFEVLDSSGRYDALRPRFLKMDRQTQGREIRKLSPAPYMLGSVQAIT